MMLKTLPALAALAVATALVVPTVSQAAELTTARVSYADLNLTTQFGQDTLQRRISFAARSVCDTADPRDFNFARAVAECRDGAIADAQPAFQAAVNNARTPSVEVLSAAALTVSAR
jgi:UrcA family protein